MLNFILLQAGQNLSESAKVAGATVQQGGMMKELFTSILNGGPIMVPIVILSLLAVFIFFERYIAIYKAGRTDSKLMHKLREYIQEGKIDLAFSLCQMKNTPTSRMIEKGITRIGRSLADVNVTIENVANLEVSKLEKRLPFLASVVGGAPMLGILGTVIGIIQAFYEMVKSENKIDLTLISTSIYQTLGTTVFGLIVGVLAYFAYNILVAHVDGVIFKFKTANSEFMDMLNELAI
jgi:biopolymer transport protein ExbB